jgi:hypothetical protein
MNYENHRVVHQTINGRYRIILERAASTKGVDGFKVEVNSDSITVAQEEIQILYDTAKMMTKGEGGMI